MSRTRTIVVGHIIVVVLAAVVGITYWFAYKRGHRDGFWTVAAEYECVRDDLGFAF